MRCLLCGAIAILALLSSSRSCDAFVTPSKFAAVPRGAVMKSSSRTPALHMLDPTHLFSDIASSLLLSDDAAVSALDAGGEVTSYSKLSYYTVLALYVMSFPGLWSQIKRSTTAKVKRKTFLSPGENNKSAPEENRKDLRQQAGEIMAYMKANNYEVVEAGETITFRGVVQRSVSQAFFLTFCTALGMASLALVLQIQFQNLQLPLIGEPNWFWSVLLSPYAGIYYWKSGDRVDDCQVKLATNDDETENEITVQGSDEELERMWRTLGWQEKGMVKVEGILENV